MSDKTPATPARFLELLARQTKEHAIINLDVNGNILWLNDGARHIFGTGDEDVIGQPVSIFFLPDDVEKGIERNEFATAAADGTAEDDRWMLRRDGSTFWATGNMIAIRDDDGKPTGFAKVLRNRTDIYEHIEMLRNAVKSLNEAALRKDRYISIISNELRHPLAPMQNALNQIKLMVPNKSEVEYCLLLIERQLALLGRTLDDLLDITRTNMGNIKLHKKTMALGKIIERALDSVHPLIKEKHHKIDILLPDAQMFVDVDADKMHQVFVNLFDNAARYTPENGRIWIKGTNEGSQAVIHIKDNGSGIPQDMQERIFELFVRVDPAGTDGAMGLGLSFVKHIMSLHDGSVQVRSEGIGKGSEFSIRLPLAYF